MRKVTFVRVFSCLPILAVQSSCKLWSSLYLENGENKEFIATLLINVVKLNWSKKTLVLLDVIIHGFFIHLVRLTLLKKGTCMNYIVLETVLEKDHVINGNRQSSWTSIMWKVLLDLQWSRIVSLLWSYITLRLWDSYLDIQKHQMTWLTKRLCDIADDQKDKCEKISKRSHERSTIQVELEESFATGERRAIWRSALTYDTFKNEATLENEARLHDEEFLVGACRGVNFWRFSIKLGWSCFITFPTRSFFHSS